jgi:hypothetical protein
MTFSISVNDYVQYVLVIPFIEAMRSHAPKIRLAKVLLVSAPLMR